MHFSIIVATNRGPEVLQYLFLNTHKESELIIVDSHYNERTKRWLSEQHGYSQIVYAPCNHSPYKWYRDFSQSLNTALCLAEHDYIVRADDYIEFKEDFFEVAEKDAKTFPKKTLIIGQKAQEYNGEEKFVDYMSRRGIGGQFRYVNVENPAFTFSFGVAPLQLFLDLNGYDERYDAGFGYDDNDFLYRALRFGYIAILDKLLMGYGHAHKPQKPVISLPQIIYNVTFTEIDCGKTWAYNPYKLIDRRAQMLEEKEKWIVK